MYFFVGLGILLDELGREARRAAVPRRHRIAQDVLRDHARLDDARRAVHAADRAGRLERVARRRPGPATIDATCWPIGSSITVVPVAPARSSIVLHSVTFWMPGPDAMRLPLRSAIVFAGLSLRDDELVEHVLRVARIGAEDLEQARLRDLADREIGRARAVGAAVGAAGQHRLHHLLRAGELERLDVESGFLEVALLDGGEERQARPRSARSRRGSSVAACARTMAGAPSAASGRAGGGGAEHAAAPCGRRSRGHRSRGRHSLRGCWACRSSRSPWCESGNVLNRAKPQARTRPEHLRARRGRRASRRSARCPRRRRSPRLRTGSPARALPSSSSIVPIDSGDGMPRRTRRTRRVGISHTSTSIAAPSPFALRTRPGFGGVVPGSAYRR